MNNAPSNTGNVNRDPNWLLVYTAMGPGDALSLRIRTWGITPDNTFDEVFTFNDQTNTVTYDGNFPTGAAKTIQDLGWFADSTLFGNICITQPVITPVGAGSVFDNWISDVLSTLETRYNHQWCRNNSNYV